MEYLYTNIVGYGIALLLITAINRIIKDPLIYVNIFSIFYGGALAANQYWYGVVIESEYLPTTHTLWIFFSAWWAFLLGALLVIRKPVTIKADILDINLRRSIIILYFMVAVNIIYTLMAMYTNKSFIAILQPDMGFINALAENRISKGGDNESIIHMGWYLELWHTAYLYYIPLALYLLRLKHIKMSIFIIIFSIGILCSLSMFSRIQLLMLLTVAFVSWIILFKPNGVNIVNKTIFALAISLLIFITMQSALDKSSKDISKDYSITAGSILDQVITYSLGPISNYQELLRGEYYEENPHDALYTLQPLYYFLAKLGYINADEYPIGYRQYVFAPFPSNVFTFLDAFTLDFGPLGAIVGVFLIGIFVAYIYIGVRTKTGYFQLVIYALSVYACLVAMLTNMFITHVFIIEMAVVFIINLIIRRNESVMIR
jgi:oligosaccharide repeat unit polymerase